MDDLSTLPDLVVKKNTTLVHMKGDTGSWETPSGVKFTKKSPYQVVPVQEAQVLLSNRRFEQATAEDAKEFFGV